MGKIRIVLVDDIEDIQNYFKMIISNESDMEIVGIASSGSEAFDVVIDTKPDIVLMDVEMETEFAGINAIQRIKNEMPDVKAIVLTIHKQDDMLFRAYGAGAVDYIIKTSSIVDIISSIRNVYNNNLSLRPDVTEKILTEFSRLQNEHDSLIYTLNVITKLSNAEYEILKAVYNGYSYKEIAKQRFVEEVTIRTQVTRILKNFKAKSMKDVIPILKQLKIFDVYL